MHKIIKLTKNCILDFLFPQNKLDKKLRKISADEMYQKCQKTKHENKNIITVFSYEDTLIKQGIKSLKFKRNKEIAKIFGQILYDNLLENLFEAEKFSGFKNPILIPIPLSKKSLRERGFNQCEIIAREMASLDNNSNFVFENNVLLKTKDTPHQSRTKNKKERLENLKNCFSIQNKEKIKGRNVILLDDVVTTGTTLKEAGKTLRKYGAKKIICLTVAH